MFRRKISFVHGYCKLHVDNDKSEVGTDCRKVPTPETRDQRLLISLPKDKQRGVNKLAEDRSASLTSDTAIDIEAYRTNQEMKRARRHTVNLRTIS